MTTELTEKELHEADALGVSHEAFAAAKWVQRARQAKAIGLTMEQFARLEAACEEAEGKGVGFTQAKWAAATGRDEHGRKLPVDRTPPPG